MARNAVAAAVLTTTVAALVRCAPAPVAPSSAPVPIPPSSATPAIAQSRAAVISPVTSAELGASWRPDCPVAPAELRRVELDYVSFDGRLHRGELIVHETVVDDVVRIFGQLLRVRYPIARMRNVDRYAGADDELSMEDNNTSAFNCRPLPHSDSWSRHAYGMAIDLNPLINPYIDGAGDLQPKNAGRYLDRRRADPGMLHNGDPAVLAFTDRGWTWGGSWRNPVDYQHFERQAVN